MKSNVKRPSIVFILVWLLIVSCRFSATPDIQPALEIASPNESPVEIIAPPSIPVTNFSLENANSTPPNDILDEVAYFVGGGQEFIPQCPENKPSFCNFDIDVFWLNYFNTVIQGTYLGEKINVLATLPNGKTVRSAGETTESDTVQKWATYEYALEITPDMPLGKYQVTFTGQNWTLQKQFTVIMPTSPVVHEFDDKLILLGFKPNEKIRFFAYEHQISNRINLINWKSLQIGPNGTLDILLPQKENAQELLYFVVTANNDVLYDGWGNVFKEPNQLFKTTVTPPPLQICAGLVSRLSHSLNAFVAKVDGTKTRIRKHPGFSQAVVGEIPQGAKVLIVGINPACKDNSTWWEVQTPDGLLNGWMAESQNGHYLLEPAP